jgi:spore maturation protein CgeB
MKLVRLTTVYPAYIDYFYAKHPELSSAPYHQQKASLDYDAFGWIDSWTYVLNPLGYDVWEIDTNIKPLQTAWARENDVSYTTRTWMQTIAIAQLRQFKPEIVFIQTEALLSDKMLMNFIKNLPTLKLLIAWVGSPIKRIYRYSECDFVLTCIPEKMEKFKKAGILCFHLNHAFDPRILERINQNSHPEHDISFIGQIVRSSRFHLGRDRLLNKLIAELDLIIFSPSSHLPPGKYIRYYTKKGVYTISRISRLNRLHGDTLKQFLSPEIIQIIKVKPLSPINPRLKPYLHPPVFGIDMYQTLRNSKITLNTHIDVSPKSASNMRLFEATGIGTCLLTDWKENLADLFEPETEVVSYKTADECIEKAKWLLENPRERHKIAEAGQKRTLTNHTFKQRAEQLDEIIKNTLQ